MHAPLIKPADDGDAAWIEALLEEHWGSVKVVTRGRVYDASQLPGFVALTGGKRAGLITYRIEDDECEIVTLNSVCEGRGVGSALIGAVSTVAREAGAKRLWLITTNDNVPAQVYYRRRGFYVAAVHEGAIIQSRKLKPEIPLSGIGGVDIRDEIEFEMTLGG